MPLLPCDNCGEYDCNNAKHHANRIEHSSTFEEPESDTSKEEKIIEDHNLQRHRHRALSQSLHLTHAISGDLENSDGDEESLCHFITDDSSDSEDDIINFEPLPQKSRNLEYIRSSEFIYPRSHYVGYSPPLPVSTEKRVIEDIMQKSYGQESEILQRSSSCKSFRFNQEEYIEVDLNDFSIYLPQTVTHHAMTLTGLQNLGVKIGHSSYCFDGILSHGSRRHYVQGVVFKLCSIGNYGQEFDEVGDNIWIQSHMNQNSKVHYRVRCPSNQYDRYHVGFLWLCNLAKHFVDYLEWASDHEKNISIHHFIKDFAFWLKKIHGSSAAYQKWFIQYNRIDFRCHIVANIDFLWKQAICISHNLSKHQIWSEVKRLDFIPLQKLLETKTVVTPYVFDCFGHLKLGVNLREIFLQENAETRRKSAGQALSLTTEAVPERLARSFVPRKLEKKSIIVGDVLAVPMDDEEVSQWKDEPSRWKAADDCWYVLVQGIHFEKDGSRSFDVLWLYKPADTACAKMKYPWCNELFLSENCSCSRRRIPEDEVLYKVPVTWYGQPGCSNIFIRQTYLDSNSFVTLKESHKQCIHLRDEVKPPLQTLVDQYKVGDTVLFVPPVQLKSAHGLEPGEIIDFVQNETEGFVNVRQLLRHRDLDNKAKARPNELVYSDEIVTVKANKVERKCYVRFYTIKDFEDRNIPVPYNCDGTGDAFYIIYRLVGGSLQPIQDLPISMTQGIDLSAIPIRHRLRGLDLYCGGGTFGRGLEEGGAIHNTHAVDLDKHAIHSYHANLKDPKSTKLFYGSVNDMLAKALKGNKSKSDLIPLPGEIDFISAGSPCPGFSQLTIQKNSEKGLRDQSLVASVAAYIDFYRPKYALLENVTTMAKKGEGRDEDVLSQLLCCLVGMGYQVQVFNLDAWSFGSPQTRSRLFVSISAPELRPPGHPGLSHSHPYETKNRGLGRMANGQAFGVRQFRLAPFKYVTAGEATEDLPDIGDARTYQCIFHPDHQMARGVTPILKAQIEVIPINPRGMNFAKTWKAQLMTSTERNLFPVITRKGNFAHSTAVPSSKAWGRIHPGKLFPTIATSITPSCSRTGKSLHWDQQRLITVLEARRAQSYPDEEVLVGAPARQWRIVGNSVARTVSLALGISIGEAWRGKASEEMKIGIEITIAHVEAASMLESYRVSSFEDQSSEDLSEEQYSDFLPDKNSSSSVRRKETSPTTPISDLSNIVSINMHSKPKKRRHNIPETLTVSPSKKLLLVPASRRDSATLWKLDNEHHAENDKKTHQTQLRNNKKPAGAVPFGAAEVIDLISDDEEGQDNADKLLFIPNINEEDEVFISTKNDFINAYARTHATTTSGSKRRIKRKL